ncbi:hypothetical protein MPTK2_4g19960 [Marchantia polymorpha subsp. ruderalis]
MQRMVVGLVTPVVQDKFYFVPNLWECAGSVLVVTGSACCSTGDIWRCYVGDLHTFGTEVLAHHNGLV